MKLRLRKAQKRLHSRMWRLLGRGKPAQKAAVAVARELAGFMWAIAHEKDLLQPKTSTANPPKGAKSAKPSRDRTKKSSRRAGGKPRSVPDS